MIQRCTLWQCVCSFVTLSWCSHVLRALRWCTPVQCSAPNASAAAMRSLYCCCGQCSCRQVLVDTNRTSLCVLRQAEATGGIAIDGTCSASLSTRCMGTRKLEHRPFQLYACEHCMQPTKFCVICSMLSPALRTRPLKRKFVTTSRCQTYRHRKDTG